MPIWEFLQRYSSVVMHGTWVTCLQFLLAALVAVSIALVIGIGKLSANPLIRGACVVYIELFRGTSLLVQLYWIFFVLPLFGITLPNFTAGFISVGLNYGAYGAELVRGAIQAVPRGQWEAATALSMSPFARMRRIILPQAIAIMLPPWGNLLIELLKGTALVSLISVTDLMFQAKQINASTYLSAQAFGTALIIYYLFARGLITPSMRWAEHAVARRLGRS
ncbi:MULTISPECIES: ectoine/hydroxyectoine ABC transporter permease subunit EhuC [Mesorhizobium]|uniref:Polar amino acid transport system permease protein n=1 Tax=Mesorhizobium muleiense TaxID=1004279 RepID=A0A1G9F1Z7_9HYPH|nr:MULTISPECIES: ectoine/hydroxyectoine ABC transporter permease subunit EhuC [Mesorhizobium]MCF6098489.1 ectoine/hydroxyectoine ABC transporter permease subunit EhuC [Mesorhizobium muleiense]RUV32392.1 ectoine/hydroxyectoine ABC transporter permease subunit EhuC [Mesorhizobium sp. M5C.F.Ca.IN.020.32.2.1]RWI50723.1 MAG: ectoine/hydroxyectoine ABC transporter permease subunit EhuC [Mesorhizobium sp.]RWP12739.1 MAG: ectoine/hydroxyectoine ABC transporter permease subunit EhuC [Mesorhizobium sp.]